MEEQRLWKVFPIQKVIHKTMIIITLQTLWLPRLTQKTKDTMKTITEKLPSQGAGVMYMKVPNILRKIWNERNAFGLPRS